MSETDINLDYERALLRADIKAGNIEAAQMQLERVERLEAELAVDEFLDDPVAQRRSIGLERTAAA